MPAFNNDHDGMCNKWIAEWSGIPKGKEQLYGIKRNRRKIFKYAEIDG